MGSPRQTTQLPQGPLLEAAQVGRWSQAVVADHAPLRGLPATSCQNLQAGVPYSTDAPPSYLSDPLLRPLPDGRPAGGPARRQSAARRGTLLGTAPRRSCNGSAASRRPGPCCHRAVAQRSSTTNILRRSHPATHCGRANTE